MAQTPLPDEYQARGVLIRSLEADRDTWKARFEDTLTAYNVELARAAELERALLKYGHHKRGSCRPSDLKPNLIWDRRGYSDNCKPDCGFSAALSKQEPCTECKGTGFLGRPRLLPCPRCGTTRFEPEQEPAPL